MNIMHVVGARPNFMKVAPVMAALASLRDCAQILVHTGQHYDKNMSDVFFEELGIPRPNINLGVGSGSHAVQTAAIMVELERVLDERRPDLVLVYGDVNSTLATALVCAKKRIRLGHVEAGLRSFDRSMPEEINRIITDQLADMLFTPSLDANEHLLHEGISEDKIYFVGNVMIDTLVRLLPKAEERWQRGVLGLEVQEKPYCLVTLHRPSNVDDPTMLDSIFKTLLDLSTLITIIFPVHPRTRERLKGIVGDPSADMHLIEPVGYLDFLALQQHATLVITDSGGIQEETTFLQVPCLTVRNNTERPITVTCGTNIIVGQDMERLKRETIRILEGNFKQSSIPPLWDGTTGQRIAEIIDRHRSA